MISLAGTVDGHSIRPYWEVMANSKSITFVMIAVLLAFSPFMVFCGDIKGQPATIADSASDPVLGIRVSSPGADWLMTSSSDGAAFRVFAAPEKEMAQGGSYPNISMQAMRGQTTMDIIGYVNSVQNQALKTGLKGYRLVSQDLLYLRGGIVAVEKTFTFSFSGRRFMARQVYSSRGTTMVVATFTSPEELFARYTGGFDDFISGMVLK